MSSRRIAIAIGGVDAVGVIFGDLCALNVLRLAGKHIDRGEPLTKRSKMQVSVGHFFIQNGIFF